MWLRKMAESLPTWLRSTLVWASAAVAMYAGQANAALVAWTDWVDTSWVQDPIEVAAKRFSWEFLVGPNGEMDFIWLGWDSVMPESWIFNDSLFGLIDSWSLDVWDKVDLYSLDLGVLGKFNFSGIVTEIEDETDYRWFWADNITVTDMSWNPAPEPITLLLMSAWLFWLGVQRYRQRR